MKPEKVYVEYLLLKIRTGEPGAWDQLLPIVQVKIRAMVGKTLGYSSGVDDCVQEAMLAIYRQVKRLKSVKAFHTWMYRISYSKCMDFIRKQSPNHDFWEPSDDGMAVVDDQLDVQSAMAALNERDQTIIYLFYAEGFKVSEIAAIMDQPDGTIKYHLFQARAVLKQQLEDQKTPLTGESP